MLMRIVYRARRAGKTTELIAWVLAGEKTRSYPFWSRVLLVHQLQEAQHLRVRGNKYGLDYNQVFSMLEWSNARLGILPVELAIDNADFILQSLIGGPNRVVSISINDESDG